MRELQKSTHLKCMAAIWLWSSGHKSFSKQV